ncbi:MAG: hypothetical protein K2Q03_02795 [Sphingobacteriaceae bacterium]|nr:hypothetical protein [Sphingobacteriaceae bacterium]
MKKYKFAWCCFGFTMVMPLFIVEHIGVCLTIGIIISILLFVRPSINIPQEVMEVVFSKDQQDDDWGVIAYSDVDVPGELDPMRNPGNL